MASNMEEANKKFLKKILRSYFDPIYTQEFKLPKYNGKVTVMNGPASMILARSGKFDKMEHLKRADIFARAAENAEKMWSKTVEKASMETFDRPYEFSDYKVSGIARSEYSEKRKNQLRTLAHSMSIFKTLARAHADAANIQNRYKLTYASNPAMKMRPEHYEYLKTAISTVIDKNPTTYEFYKAQGLSDMRYRWDLFHAAKLDRDFMNALYEYLNDDQIDTALKAITGKTGGKQKKIQINPRPRKYVTVIIGQGNYGQGWEDETSYLDDKDGREEARADRKSYRENSGYPFRLIHRKVKIEDYEKGNF